MNQDLLNAYSAHQRSDETVRDTEAHALLSCASKLETVRQEGTSREAFGEAVRHNQKLWTIFQISLCEPDNPLPRDLKILLLNLSRYVDKVSFRAVSENNPNLLGSLININRTIAKGLTQKPESQVAAPAPQEPSSLPASVITSA